MKYILAFLLMLSVPCWAQVPMTGAGKSSGGTPPPTYTGLGDLSGLTTPLAYWGTDGVTNAYTGNALNVCDASGANCGDFTVTNGQLNVSNRGATDCHGGTCKVATIYDQTAGAHCGGSCDLVQSNNLYRANLTFNCSTTGHWCLTFTGVDSGGGHWMAYGTAAGMTQASPVTITEAANNNNIGAQASFFFDSSSVQLAYNLSNAASNVFIYEGSLTPSATASDNAYHSISGLYNGASSTIVVDGSAGCIASCATGTTTGINGILLLGSTDITADGQPFKGTFCNMAIYGFGITTGGSSQATAISTNQHSFACGGGF